MQTDGTVVDGLPSVRDENSLNRQRAQPLAVRIYFLKALIAVKTTRRVVSTIIHTS